MRSILNRSILLAGAALASLAAVPALADSAISYNDNWSGAYVGVHLGNSWVDFDRDSNPGASGSSDTLMGGGQIGYNWQRPDSHMVLGLEGDFSVMDASTRSGALSFDEDWMMTVRGRAGYAMGRLMPYVTAGLALTSTNAEISGVGSDSGLEPGIAAGGGIDGMITDKWVARVEYLYVDVPTENYNTGGTSFSGGSTNNTVRVGLNYRL